MFCGLLCDVVWSVCCGFCVLCDYVTVRFVCGFVCGGVWFVFWGCCLCVCVCVCASGCVRFKMSVESVCDLLCDAVRFVCFRLVSYVVVVRACAVTSVFMCGCVSFAKYCVMLYGLAFVCVASVRVYVKDVCFVYVLCL